MGLGGVAIVILPSIMCLKLTFSDGLGGVKPCKRVSNLYVHLLLIYILMVPIASYVRPDMYPGSLSVFLKNVTSWQCSYIILMIASKWIFVIFDKLKWFSLIGILVIVWMGTVYILKHFNGDTLSSNMLFYNIFLAVFMLPSFTLGYMANRFLWVNKIKVLFTRCKKGMILCVCSVVSFRMHR